MTRTQHFYNGVLRQVSILVLIDHYVLEAALVLGQRIREMSEQHIHL